MLNNLDTILFIIHTSTHVHNIKLLKHNPDKPTTRNIAKRLYAWSFTLKFTDLFSKNDVVIPTNTLMQFAPR